VRECAYLTEALRALLMMNAPRAMDAA